MSLLKADIRKLAAVARVPAQRRASKPRGLVDQEQDDLERIGQAHEVELGGRREGDRGVPGVEGAAKAT